MRASQADAAQAGARFGEGFLRKLERLSILAKRVSRGGARAERRTRRSGAGLEFADHRDYTPGDDLRRIDWNLLGRVERPLVRLYEEAEDLPVYLLVDASASMGMGAPTKLDLACEVAAALAYVALAGLDRVAVIPMGGAGAEALGPMRGKGQVHAILRALGALRAAGPTDLTGAVTRFLARHRRPGVVVLVSDFFDPAGHEDALDRLRYARHESAVVQITSADETRPALASDVVLVDVETGVERLVTVTPAVRAAYEARFRALLEAVERGCRKRAIPCFQVQAHEAFEDVVLRLFRAGGLIL